jgi:hypothetical protein
MNSWEMAGSNIKLDISSVTLKGLNIVSDTVDFDVACILWTSFIVWTITRVLSCINIH